MVVMYFDVYLVYERFTLQGRLRLPLADDWDGYSNAWRYCDRECGKVLRENRIPHGVPSMGQYLEVHKLASDDPTVPWCEFLLRGGVKPQMQWTTTHNPIPEKPESENQNGEIR